MVLCKLPNAICFQSFLGKSNIGYSSSNIYDIVVFVYYADTYNKLMLATKIKQRCQACLMTQLSV
jgi:hypothetical protein